MSFLVIGGVTVDVAWPDGSENRILEIGDYDRAFAGNMLSSIRARKQQWQIRTRHLTATEHTALRSALEAVPPLICSGDLLGGTVNCTAVLVADNLDTIAEGRRNVVSFELYEV